MECLLIHQAWAIAVIDLTLSSDICMALSIVGNLLHYLLVGQIVGPVCGPYEPHT
jgi:hypothetical protein